MRLSRSVSLIIIAASLALTACPPQRRPERRPELPKAPAALQSVDVTSHITGRLGDRQVEITVVGPAVHSQTALRVIFTAKQLIAVKVDPVVGPLTVTLNPRRESVGTLASAKFPTEHRQSFFLQLESEQMGTLVSDQPVVLSAEIDSSPPTATYRSVSGDVAFYKQGDPGRTSVFTIEKVTSEVKPAVSQAIDVDSRLTARVNGQQANLRLVGSAVHLLSGRSVLFIAKRLVAVDDILGPVTVGLNPARASAGTLSSPTFPADHTQSFFLEIRSEKMGTLISDEPLTLSAHIASSPPAATYRSDGRKVDFYRRDDREKTPVLTVERVESDVTAPTQIGVDVKSRLVGRVGNTPVDLTLVGPAAHVQVGRLVIFTAKQLLPVEIVDPLGPITVTLDRRRESVGTLRSDSFPTEHRQDFFLRIQSEQWGTLVSDAPLTLAATIDSSPPTATYRSMGPPVAFYKEGDPAKTPALIVERVTSEVSPSKPEAIDVLSRLTASVGGRSVDLALGGRAVHLRSRTSVVFIAKRLVSLDPSDLVGPLTVTLNPQRQSVGTLSSPDFPAEHRQSFFLQIESQRWGSLVSEEPITLAARIDGSPPTATYKSDGEPVKFYQEGDRERTTVLTIERVESEVSPPRGETYTGETHAGG